MADLYLKGITGNFDVNHYLSIHKYLFDEIYPFAGEIRSENIQKDIPFCLPNLIYENLVRTLEQARKNLKKITNEEELIKFLADFYAELDIIHPFREGNGRTEREFLRQYMLMLNEVIDFGEYVLDYSKIDAEYAFVLDSGGSPGEIIVKAPAQDAIKVKITGKPAHAGLQPENGISAIMVAARAIENMKLLRIDEETTANIGIVKGGIATNIVMPELEIVAEARSLSEEKLDAQTNHMVETFKNAAKEFGAEIEIEVKRAYGPFNIDETDEIVQLVKKAFSNMNIEGKTASTGGGSDTNILNKNGIKSVNLGIGMKKAHTLEEYIAIEDLINSAVMVGEIIKEA